MRIGVGITTRNRPKTIDKALQHFTEFGLHDTKLVVVDDFSDPRHDIGSVIDRHPVVNEFRASPKRLGIAGAKNACIASLQDCDHVFLFDDDAWPIREGWQNAWIDAITEHSVGHSMFSYDLYGIDERHPIQPVGTFGHGLTEMTIWNNCLGVALHFTRDCLDTLGGYDYWNVAHTYGFEHVQMSRRAKEAGFTRGYEYLSPSVLTHYIYSQDVDYMLHLGMDGPPLGRAPYEAAIMKEEKRQHNLNLRILDDPDIHIPLVDPFTLPTGRSFEGAEYDALT